MATYIVAEREITMTNLYIGMFRDIIKNFYTKTKSVANDIRKNNQKYSPEYAESENVKAQEKVKQYYADSKNTVNELFEQVREYLAIANFPNVEDLTADRMFFTDDTIINLTADEVKYMVERYANNFTMLRIIKDWISKKHDGMNDYTPVAISINLPNDILGVYKKFADSALSLIDSIYNDVDNFNELNIQAYGDENFSSNLYAIVGNGMGLSDYKSRRVPESAKHCFDSVSLALDNNSQLHNSPMSFNFSKRKQS